MDVKSFLAQKTPLSSGGKMTLDFASDIRKFAKKVDVSLDIAFQKICLDLFQSLVKKSPVDTGRFRGNWQVGVNGIDYTIDSKEDKSGGYALNRGMETIFNTKAGNVIYLTNSLPYSLPLEYGWSKQAPQGMVRLTLIEYRANIKMLLEG